jgi:hypothetical protein
MSTVVELEIEPNELNKNFAFVLDDPVQGLLYEDIPPFSFPIPISVWPWRLGGLFLVPITQYARSVKVTRGKNRETDNYNPGLANVVFNNHDRTFDPLHASSPLYTHIVPRRALRITYQYSLDDINISERAVFVGLIDDWNLSYDLSGDSTASAAASDATTLFASRVIPEGLQTAELTGTRLLNILSLPQFTFPWYDTAQSAGNDPLSGIREGQQTLAADTVEEGQNALDYFQKVARSEPGSFFVDGAGRPVFLDRQWTPSTVDVLYFTDEPADPSLGEYNYNDVAVQYGSEYLLNEIIVKSGVEDVTATAIDPASQALYGTRTLVRDGLLISDDESLVDMSVYFANKYSLPEYRFDSLGFIEGPNEKNTIPIADLGTLALITYTPNKVGDPIERYAEVISFDYEADPNSRSVRLGFSAIDQLFWTLDSAIFGRLSAGNRMGY